MTYNGKEVLTPENFDYATAKIGDLVSQAVVDNAMACLPSACMSSECAQMGEPYSVRVDPNTGKHRDTFATFKRVTEGRDGIWKYCGHCLVGENVERRTEPPYVRLWEGQARRLSKSHCPSGWTGHAHWQGLCIIFTVCLSKDFSKV